MLWASMRYGLWYFVTVGEFDFVRCRTELYTREFLDETPVILNVNNIVAISCTCRIVIGTQEYEVTNLEPRCRSK